MKKQTIIFAIFLLLSSSSVYSQEYDSSLFLSTGTVMAGLDNNKMQIVDVRSKTDFEKCHIPVSINIPLHAIKTKTFLKSSMVVLVNEGYDITPLEKTCLELNKSGFKAYILSGGLNAWLKKGSSLAGDPFAAKNLAYMAAEAFYTEKDFENWVIVDASKEPNIAQGIKNVSDKKINPQLFLIYTSDGSEYEQIEKSIEATGVAAFYLSGGFKAYEQYLNRLALSRLPKSERMKKITKCNDCGDDELEYEE